MRFKSKQNWAKNRECMLEEKDVALLGTPGTAMGWS